MINEHNFPNLLQYLGFNQDGKVYTKHFDTTDNFLQVNFTKQEMIYPTGLKINSEHTTNFSSKENFVVFECVHRLLEKGYKPEHIELEPKWKVGHGASGGRADILVSNHQGNPLILIECKTAGREFNDAWKDTKIDGGQLFTYAQQIPNTEYLCLYASDYDEDKQEIRVNQSIISHKDNAKILQQDDKLKSFKDAQNLRERYEVWKYTYQLEATESGIFEPNIQPYQIGKDKYTLDHDTRPIDATDKKGKYHLFRTILRTHNIARKENAFEVLVNLFLCKIVDEKENKEDLKFYWKGIANDNYFDFVDRLQELYKTGMKKFLGQEITYISNDEIESAFWTVKNKRNATKKQILKFFRNLKFFTNNAFALTDVYNEDIFRKNVKVLIKIVQMWQGLRLKTKEPNQFLGDMFEYFLDNSIKQSEGQFFTPVPVCKFIIMCLPLETMIQQTPDVLNALDYACGAGHFVNEYAAQIKPYVKQYKQTELSEYYKGIYGIEKEDRLAKVAKISAFMYGQDEINILDADALDDVAIEKYGKLPAFDVLAANPPFAVEDFLETLEEKQREKYDLFSTVSDLGSKNIQCFFIERAKQLLALNGVAGIIVPSSVLSNSDSTHVGSREILLKFFDIISIVELGSGTFGKTGTNTVVLFLRRKAQQPEPSEHFKNRVEDFFEGIQEGDAETAEYQDLYLIRRYCEHIQVPYNEYIKLLSVTTEKFDTIAPLFEYEMFQDYRTEFDKSTEIVNLKKKATFKNKPENEQATELNKRLLEYLHAIEKDKLYYFILAENNPQKVLIVKSPTDGKEQKQFLGYEWSGAKGQEGIKYNGGEVINAIKTPLFDPNNVQNSDKINFYIQQNYLGNHLPIPEHLQSFISFAPLVDLLDFTRKDFNKALSITPKKNAEIIFESKWDLAKVGDLSLLLQRGKSAKYGNSQIQVIKSGQARGFKEFDFTEKFYADEQFQTDERLLQKGDLLINSTGVGTAGRVTLFTLTGMFVVDSHVTIFRPNEKILPEFALQCFAYIGFKTIEQMAMGATGQVELSISTISGIKIPLPPLPVQSEIVAESEAIDNEVDRAKGEIANAKDAIENAVLNNHFPMEKLAQVAYKVSDAIDPQGQTGIATYIGLENIESNTGRLVGNVATDYADIKSTKTCFNKGDILYGKLRPNLNKVYLAKEDGICSTDILVFRFKNEGLAGFYKYYFLTRNFNDEVLRGVSGQQLPRTSWGNMQAIQIPVPPLSELQEIVAEIETLEQQIDTAQEVIDTAAARKQAVMRKYL
jgi:type I restriction enzyme M protein